MDRREEACPLDAVVMGSSEIGDIVGFSFPEIFSFVLETVVAICGDAGVVSVLSSTGGGISGSRSLLVRLAETLESLRNQSISFSFMPFMQLLPFWTTMSCISSQFKLWGSSSSAIVNGTWSIVYVGLRIWV